MRPRVVDPQVEYQQLCTYIERIRQQIAVPFGCTVWVLHQIAGQYCKLPPHHLLHHHQAMGCGSFADRADFAFVFSNKNTEDNTGLLTCTKAPFTIATPTRKCHIHGEFGEITPVAQQPR